MADHSLIMRPVSYEEITDSGDLVRLTNEVVKLAINALSEMDPESAARLEDNARTACKQYGYSTEWLND